MYGLKMKIKNFILIFCVSFAVSQACDSSRDVTQCSDGEICRNNRCLHALICGGDDKNPCPATSGLTCVTNYCQPDHCNSIGKCVHGQVCSQNTNRRCVYPSVYHIKEGSEFTLAFEEPASPGSYEEIQWYKGGRSNTDRVAVTDSNTQYYGDLCTGHSPCSESGRAHLNRDTGDLTIKNMSLRDEGFYYYNFSGDDNSPDTGYKYEYKLNVYVTPALTIQGIPDNYAEVGTNLTLTCTADRIRPEPVDMYWEINGRNVTGNLTADADGDGVFSQTIVYNHKVTKEDEGNPIKCAVVPLFTDQSRKDFVEKSVNPGYSPTGRPTIKTSGQERYNGSKVTLTCENPPSSGNPDCDLYTWRRLEGNINFTPETQIYTFIMDEFHAGNYTCHCGNEFGNSSDSDVVEMLYLGVYNDTYTTDYAGLITACAIGVLVLVALVIVAVIVCKRYKVKFSMYNKFWLGREREDNIEICEALDGAI